MRRRSEFTMTLLDALCTPDRAASGTPPTLSNAMIAGRPASKSAA
jgi:hypothetical protein